MTVLKAPIVYVGPTLAAEEVRRIMPDSIVRSSIARGDLYRDRLLRGSVFVILDGVFFQQRALSPREILDVIVDGGLVIGASSLGALRAAECWPAGMRGIGSIYRLLRAGALASDDEVAVAYDPDAPSSHTSVALVNVRYAVWRGVRERQLDAALAGRIVEAASSRFYAERHWPRILRDAEIDDPDGRLRCALASYDLKRLDALRALARVRRWRAANPEFCVRPRRSTGPLVPSDTERERSYDALDGRPAVEAMRELAGSLLSSGRYRRYVDRQRFSEFSRDEANAAEKLIAVVRRHGELEAELFRARAVRQLAARSVTLGVTPSPIHRQRAGEQMLIEHHCDSWQALLALGQGDAKLEETFESHRELLARALAMRDRC